MTQRQPVLIALYDAYPGGAHFADASLYKDVRVLANAIARSGMQIVARQGSPLVAEAVSVLAGSDRACALVLSPAATAREHAEGFRLPHLPASTVYTGRGGTGADAMAMRSAAAAVILGSEHAALDHILSQAEQADCVLGILTREPAVPLSERLHAARPELRGRVRISDDPDLLVANISETLRRRSFGQ